MRHYNFCGGCDALIEKSTLEEHQHTCAEYQKKQAAKQNVNNTRADDDLIDRLARGGFG